MFWKNILPTARDIKLKWSFKIDDWPNFQTKLVNVPH